MELPSLIALCAGVAGCLIGLAGWLCRSRADSAAEWREQISTRLDCISATITGRH